MIMRSQTTFFAIMDIFSVTLVFSIFLFIKPGPFLDSFQQYSISFLLFLAIWMVVSFSIDKYNIASYESLHQNFKQIIIGNFLVMGIATSMMFLIRIDYFSRTIVFGTILATTLVELIWSAVYFSIRTANLDISETLTPPKTKRKSLLQGYQETFTKNARKKAELKSREDAILVEIDQDAFEFIFNYANIESAKTLVISTSSYFNIDTQLEDKFESIVNLKRINDVRHINMLFESANAKLPIGGLLIDFVESKNLRKKRILKKFPPVLNYIAYTIDFIIKRIFPKFLLTKNIYFFLTRGQNRVLSKGETYGRLYACGFEVIDEKLISNHLFFIARKTGNPLFPEDPSYGPLVKLKRVGYKGEIIKVYKLRTMHPYAEFLQEYIYKNGGLQEGGKFKSDFRISTIGKIFRTFWLDELPMLVNLMKRELKIVGVRPLSKQYFSLYTKEHRERRINYKPGLIPPFYVDYPKTLKEIIESEIKYMDAYDKHPFRTDLSYFFKAIFNIIFKKYRSN
jgi:lipopolysaccharide/colanic/teichoic acid biosynthesis glycosyltransferase